MSTLDAYLDDKRRALADRAARIRRGAVSPVPLSARATVEGRSGARRISIRRHAVVTDSLPDFAGSDLGPGSPELQLGVLGSCLAHTVLIQAALQDLPIASLEVEVTGTFDPRAGAEGFADIPVHPQDLAYAVRIGSEADPARIEALQARVEAVCPILNLLRLPQAVTGRFEPVEVPAHPATEIPA
ncbi:OsmC family protein [Methylobacterium sp. NMS12]|uniref:OsmC family protein n=1 Tax=Methylobacterium sp. NMS12 TaxID=3079766 RepID=UPI003F881508